MRRRRHKLEVSTFPFLAVLLCAMGSLILMLLVLDRRARSVAVAKPRQAASQASAEDARIAAARQAEWEQRRQTLHQQLERERDELATQATAVQTEIQKTDHDDQFV